MKGKEDNSLPSLSSLSSINSLPSISASPPNISKEEPEKGKQIKCIEGNAVE